MSKRTIDESGHAPFTVPAKQFDLPTLVDAADRGHVQFLLNLASNTMDNCTPRPPNSAAVEPQRERKFLFNISRPADQPYNITLSFPNNTILEDDFLALLRGAPDSSYVGHIRVYVNQETLRLEVQLQLYSKTGPVPPNVRQVSMVIVYRRQDDPAATVLASSEKRRRVVQVPRSSPLSAPVPVVATDPEAMEEAPAAGTIWRSFF